MSGEMDWRKRTDMEVDPNERKKRVSVEQLYSLWIERLCSIGGNILADAVVAGSVGHIELVFFDVRSHHSSYRYVFSE